MAPGEMQIDGCVIERRMAEQYLNGAQVRAGFKQVGGITMAQGMRRDVLLDAGSARRALASEPDHLVGDRHVGTPAVDQSGEQIRFRLHPSPVGA
jgi:hypothetical protein